MPYATQADIVDAYGIDLLSVVADRNDDGEIDTTAVERALTAATSIIDAHVLARFPSPWPEVPGLVRDLCIDIALYKMSGEGRGLTDERRTRYEDALAFLKRVADGKADLGLPGSAAAPVRAGAVVASGERRRFSRTSLRGL
ncbi:MAG: gp436 family protein [Rhodospirillaceae bacterium]